MGGRWIRKKKHTFFLGVLVHTSGCCSSVIMVVEGQGVLRMRMNGGQSTSGWVTWVDPDPDPKVKSTMLRRVYRKLHADHSTPPSFRPSSSATLLRLGQHPVDLDEVSDQPLVSFCNIFHSRITSISPSVETDVINISKKIYNLVS